MKRREYLAGVAGVVALAGCSSNSSQSDPTPTPEPAGQSSPEPTSTPTPSPPPSVRDPISKADDPEWYLDALKYEAELSGLDVDGVSREGNSITVDLVGPESLGSLLSISRAYTSEILRQGYESDVLNIWYVERGTQEYQSIFRIEPAWIIDWVNGDLTSGQFLANIFETKEDPP
jgi:hypothetical protein